MVVRAQRLGDDVAGRHARVERRHRILEDDAHVAAQRAARGGVELAGVATEHDDAPRVGGGQLEDLQQRRRLAAARLADEPERLALADVEADPVDGVHGPDAALEDRALVQREAALECVDLEHDGALVARHGRERRRSDDRHGEDALGRQPVAGDVGAAVTGGTLAAAPDRGQRRLDLATELHRQRAARRERAARRQVRRATAASPRSARAAAGRRSRSAGSRRAGPSCTASAARRRPRRRCRSRRSARRT